MTGTYAGQFVMEVSYLHIQMNTLIPGRFT